MVKHNQVGAISGLVISFVLVVILLLGSLYFGYWAYSQRQTYKNHTDQLINAAVNTAEQNQQSKLDAQFAQQEKFPLTTYNGPQAYGSIVVMYPKTWSGYVDSTGQGSALLNGYFNPGVVPSLSDQSSIFALNVQVINEPYSQTIQGLMGQNNITATAYALPKMPKVVGVEVTGPLINNQTNATEILLPLRSYTLQIETYGTQYLSDFNNIILPNFSFSP